MPTIVWTSTLSVLLVLVIAYAIMLGNRVFQLQIRVQTLETFAAQLEKTERLTPARMAELAELREAVARADELLVKVNRREIARSKARSADGTYAAPVNGTDKDAMRRAVGLRAGQPAPHR